LHGPSWSSGCYLHDINCKYVFLRCSKLPWGKTLYLTLCCYCLYCFRFSFIFICFQLSLFFVPLFYSIAPLRYLFANQKKNPILGRTCRGLCVQVVPATPSHTHAHSGTPRLSETPATSTIECTCQPNPSENFRLKGKGRQPHHGGSSDSIFLFRGKRQLRGGQSRLVGETPTSHRRTAPHHPDYIHTRHTLNLNSSLHDQKQQPCRLRRLFCRLSLFPLYCYVPLLWLLTIPIIVNILPFTFSLCSTFMYIKKKKYFIS